MFDLDNVGAEILQYHRRQRSSVQVRGVNPDIVQRCVRLRRPFNPPRGTARGHNRRIPTIHARALDGHHTSDSDIPRALRRALSSELLPSRVDLHSLQLRLPII